MPGQLYLVLSNPNTGEISRKYRSNAEKSFATAIIWELHHEGFLDIVGKDITKVKPKVFTETYLNKAIFILDKMELPISGDKAIKELVKKMDPIREHVTETLELKGYQKKIPEEIYIFPKESF